MTSSAGPNQGGMEDEDAVLAEVRIEEGSELVGMSLSDYGSNQGQEISFVALQRAGEPVHIPPRGDTVFIAKDHLIVAGRQSQVSLMNTLSEQRTSAA